MDFEWDSAKAESNATKHGASFVEAMTIFGDPLEETMEVRWYESERFDQ